MPLGNIRPQSHPELSRNQLRPVSASIWTRPTGRTPTASVLPSLEECRTLTRGSSDPAPFRPTPSGNPCIIVPWLSRHYGPRGWSGSLGAKLTRGDRRPGHAWCAGGDPRVLLNNSASPGGGRWGDLTPPPSQTRTRANRKKRLTVLYIVEHPNQEGDTCIDWTSQYCWTNGWNCLWRGHSVYRTHH